MLDERCCGLAPCPTPFGPYIQWQNKKGTAWKQSFGAKCQVIAVMAAVTVSWKVQGCADTFKRLWAPGTSEVLRVCYCAV